ncbi:MAG: RNA polymerase sigma-54 factor [Planctomycetota bacterium]|nr:MAG: RNA polymerase sigma-54 factor [Planctomycetota bacterium]
MRLEYQQNLRMEQRLLQSPQMIQAMQILQCTTQELLDRIETELEDNPFLESDLPKPESGPETETGGEGEETGDDEPGEDLPELGEIDQIFEPGERPSGPRGDGEERWDMVQDLPAPEEQTTETILAELRVSDAEPEEIRAAEAILAALDPRGFLPEGSEGVAAAGGLDPDLVEHVLHHLRDLAHPALGARDLREAYLLQLAAMPEEQPLATALVRDHFDDLLANRLPQIAKALGVTLGDVREALEVLRGLDSRPLAEYEQDASMSIVPDVIVLPDEDGGYRVQLARDGLPELRLSDSAKEALDRAKGNKKLHAHLMKKIERARWLLDAVAQRRRTLLRVATELVRRQREFLDYGPERLRPLKMQEVAEAIGVHISTVSRAIRGKWAQTPQGILPLKGFFSGGQTTSSGGQTSRIAIQERIREIIEQEDRTSPLSDEEIVRILRQRNGVKVARRTVTKYRKALGIPSSNLRRVHGE